MSFLKHVLGLLLLALFMQSCHDGVVNPYQTVDIDALEEMKSSSYALNSQKIRNYIGRLVKQDGDSMIADYRTRNYYIKDGAFLWIDRHGLDERADTLLHYLGTIEQMGFNKKKFAIPQIEKDLERIRQLDLVDDKDTIDINQVMARLEYYLTKAYLRYTAGQRYGFVNPTYLLNRIDEKDPVSQNSNDTTNYEI
ncbi:MAG: L,D-transpeptidase, partial [Prevotella sp.]|nr:L,D-transpeptidase [Prevotella sp.]